MSEAAKSTIDQSEVDRFSAMAAEWWSPTGKFKPLHKFNPVRLAYIRDRACENFNRDPKNIRNTLAFGGGALMDIGCYLVAMSRYVFGAEPHRVMALIDRDPEFAIDRLTSGILDFGSR